MEGDASPRLILFVCSGNTCRSPMAAGLAMKLLADADPRDRPLAVSAGTSARPGAPASPPTLEAMRRYRVDLSRHRSQPLTPELIAHASEVYVMTAAHRVAVLGIAPMADGKTQLLDPAGKDVADPYGEDQATYDRCAKRILELLESRLHEWTKP